MLLIGVVVALSGAGIGFLLIAVACTAMMAMMMKECPATRKARAATEERAACWALRSSAQTRSHDPGFARMLARRSRRMLLEATAGRTSQSDRQSGSGRSAA